MELVPPKPKELQSTLKIEHWKLKVEHSSPRKGVMQVSSCSSQPRFVGMKSFWSDRMLMTVSIEPEAEVAFPVKPFVLDIGGTTSSKTLRMAALSLLSLLGVPVP